MKSNLYPLQFQPILKERIWGGEKLKTILNKSITSKITGESWELSTVEGDVSVVINGELKGKSLTELIEDQSEEILGTDTPRDYIDIDWKELFKEYYTSIKLVELDKCLKYRLKKMNILLLITL